MCKCLGVNRSSYYTWHNSKPSPRTVENELLSEKIRIIFVASRHNYGTRRIKRALAKQGITLSRRRIGRLLNKMGLSCKTKRKFKVTTDSKHKLPVADNILNRRFTVDKPDKFYVGDITYINTKKE